MFSVRPDLRRLSLCVALCAVFGACGEGDGDGEFELIEAGAQPSPDASVATTDAGSPGDAGNAAPNVPQVPFDSGAIVPVEKDAGSDAGAISPVDSSVPRDGGGSTSDGGSTPPTPGKKSAGCGKTGSPMSGMYNIDVAGTQRMYIIKLPANYDANKAYKLIFTWHYLGGSARGIAASYYGLEAMSGGSTIFVSPEGIGAAWPNTGGRDVAFAKAMVDKFKADYCIDEGRVFSTGFSYGAIMSNTVGCAMGDVFRAIAPMAGSGPRGRCVGQVATWIAHGSADTTVSFASGQASRDTWRTANHCMAEADAPDANGCISYKGCDPGFPVVWCQTTADHTQPSFGPRAIWQFFSQF